MKKRRWTTNEIEILKEKWGVLHASKIAEKFNRTIESINRKAYYLGLGGSMTYGDYVTASVAWKMLKVNKRTLMNWVFKYGLTAKRTNHGIWKIKMNDLEKWLKNNLDKWNASRIELYALGHEPEWLVQKRKEDKEKYFPKEWTRFEEARLMHLIKLGKSLQEIAIELNRTIPSIRGKLLKIREKSKKGA